MRNENVLHGLLTGIALLCFVMLVVVANGLRTVIAWERHIAAIEGDTDDTVVIMLPPSTVSSVCNPAPSPADLPATTITPERE